MRFKLTILLIILNVAIACLIFYVDKHQGSRRDFLEQSKIIVDPSFLEEVNAVEIANARSGERWQLQKVRDDEWEISRPVHWKANPYAVQQLLFQLKTLSWSQRFPVGSLASAGQSLQSYDLENPPLTILLEKDGRSLTLAFGAPTEIGNRLYLLSPDGDYILVIPRNLATGLQQSLEQFLDKRLFGVGLEGSHVIQIQDRAASNVRVRMERSGRDWRFVSPIEAAADNARVEAVLADWQQLEGRNFRMPKPEDPQFAGEGLRLTVEGLNSRESMEFSVNVISSGDQKGQYYLARMEGYESLFEVSAGKVDALRKIQEDLRERRILSRHAENWTSMEIRFDNLSTTLQRLENGAWQVLHTSSDGQLVSQPADLDIIENTRKLLAELEAVRFVSDAPSETDLARYGLDVPQRRITLRSGIGTGVELSIGGLSIDSEESLLYATTNEQASVFLLRPHVLGSIPLNPIYYRERTIRSVPETVEVTAMEIENLGNGAVMGISREQHPLQWTTMQAYLRKVEVSSFIRSKFATPLQLSADRTLEWKYKLHGTLRYPAAAGGETREQKLTLYLSERVGGTTQYIGDAENGLVGILPPDVIEALDPLLVEFPADPGPPPPLKNPPPDPPQS